MRFFAALLVGLVLAAAARAQSVSHIHDPGGICTLYDVGGEARPGPTLDLASVQARHGAEPRTVMTQGQAATFSVTYSGFTPEAEAAFQRAVDIWADHLTSSVTIRVNATFGPLGERVLGSAGPRLFRDFGAGMSGTWYPAALADALANRNLVGNGGSATDADIQAVFNSDFDRFFFGAGTTPADQFDFTSIVLHELGHGLGFIGSGEVDDGIVDPDDRNNQECAGIADRGCWGYFGGQFLGFPFIFDRFIEDANGTAFLNTTTYPNNSVPLGNLLQSEQLFVDAPTVTALNGGERPPIWAPSPFEAGSSFSHWDEVIFTPGTNAALMTPRIAAGEQFLDPGSITCAFFQDMGWALGAGCSLLVTGGEPPAPEIDVPASVFGLIVSGSEYRDTETEFPDFREPLRFPGPNPFRNRSIVLLEVGEAQDVMVELFDVLGRRVAVLLSDTVQGVRDIEVDGSVLAPGVYIVRARGDSAVASVSLTHVE